MWQVAAADQYFRFGGHWRGGSGVNSSGTGIARIGRASVGLGARLISRRVEGLPVGEPPGSPLGLVGGAGRMRSGGPLRRRFSSSCCAIRSTSRLSSGGRVEVAMLRGRGTQLSEDGAGADV